MVPAAEESNTNLITLHLGEASCHLGAHLYNRQHRYYFQHGETPRAVFVDFKHNLANSEEQPEAEPSEAQWDGKVEKIVTNDFEPITPVDSYSKNDELKWGRNLDFKLRNQSVVDMPYCKKFDSFLTGHNFYKTQGLEERFEDNLRFFAEGCDNLQGFITVCDMSSGYSGFLPPLYALLDDIYGSKARLTLPLIEQNKELDIFEMDSLLSGGASSLLNMLQKDSPAQAQLKHILNSGTNYHSSALLSIVVSQILDPLYSGTHLKEFTNSLTPIHRTLFSSSISVPFSTPATHSTGDPTSTLSTLFSEKWFTDNMACLSPGVESVSHPLHHTYLSLCGVPKVADNAAFTHQLTALHSELFSNTTRYVYSGEPMRLSQSFPQFFNADVLSNGNIRWEHGKSRTQPVESLPVMLCLQNSKACGNVIDQTLLQKNCKSVEMTSAGVSDDDFRDAKQRIYEISDNYKL